LLEGIYGGFSLEVGRVGNPLIPGNEQGTLKSASLLLGVDTPIGPLYLGYGWANHGYGAAYLYLGRP
jgi:NTE family protein